MPSSLEPTGAGSTYLRVVKSNSRVSECGSLIGLSGNCDRTLLLVDLHLDVEVEQGNDNVASDVGAADAVEHKRIVERDALRDLHHAEHNDKVGAVKPKSVKPTNQLLARAQGSRCPWWWRPIAGVCALPTVAQRRG